MNYEDMDGDFDVVGIDEETGLPIIGARGGYGGGRGYGGRGGGGYGRHPAGFQSGAMRGGTRGPMSAQRGGGRPAAGRAFPFGGLARGGAFPGLPPGVNAPPWMTGAWGVTPPNEMLHVLPLVPQQSNGVFTAAVSTIQFLARPQKPFRGERIISQIANSGASAATTLPVTTSIFVGTDLQQVESGNIPISTWAATAFGVRLAMVDALPGIEITMNTTLLGGPLTTTDTVTVTLTLLGRVLA